MTSDESRRGRDVAFKPVGTGMNTDQLCAFCGKKGQKLGSRMRGPTKRLFSCPKCEEERGKR